MKVEASKFTEVGYVGRDVDSIARDLVDAAIRLVKDERRARVADRAAAAAEERLVDLLVAALATGRTGRAVLADGRDRIRRDLRTASTRRARSSSRSRTTGRRRSPS